MIAALAAPAGAADMAASLPVKAPAVGPLYDWSGFFVGVNAGYGLGRDPTSSNDVLFGSTSNFSIGPQGVLGGVQAGYNWQSGHVVVGAEADFQGSAQRDSVCVSRCLINFPGFNAASQIDESLSWFGTVRGRLGWAQGPALFYLTGGLAYGRVENTVTRSETANPTQTFRVGQVNTGWTAGVGMETGIAHGWSVKAEYLYVDLGSITNSYIYGFFVVPETVSSNIRDHVFRVGLNYRPSDRSNAYAAMPPPAPVVSSWAGVHIGLNTGYAVARNPTSDLMVGLAPMNESFNLDPSGWIGGGQVGIDRQFGSWVAGLEADIQASSQKSSYNCLSCSEAGPFSSLIYLKMDQSLPWFGTVRGRLGWSTPTTLLYATGGFAYGQANLRVSYYNNSFVGPDFSTTVTQSGVKSGWTVGGGSEMKLGGAWSAKVEYLYVDLGSQSVSFVHDMGLGFTRTITDSTSVHEQVARVGLNYRFD
ncbi:outer membrane protein [Bradyrhizobium commune]|uniref:Porin family protein n=1 Tax=Bradyrhizobium commune TaxID=83627 RepID=A0A7S9D722_9BRAD|nr:outer membrane beta-barrel protein [Bradyrhizobium commune]QPF92417.1 porin family protein [Bradyrhizobium commune]